MPTTASKSPSPLPKSRRRIERKTRHQQRLLWWHHRSQLLPMGPPSPMPSRAALAYSVTASVTRRRKQTPHLRQRWRRHPHRRTGRSSPLRSRIPKHLRQSPPPREPRVFELGVTRLQLPLPPQAPSPPSPPPSQARMTLLLISLQLLPQCTFHRRQLQPPISEAPVSLADAETPDAYNSVQISVTTSRNPATDRAKIPSSIAPPRRHHRSQLLR